MVQKSKWLKIFMGGGPDLEYSGICPSCGAKVYSGWGKTDKECPYCGADMRGRGMTNGEKLQSIFPNMAWEIKDNTVLTNVDNGLWFSLDWWNAEYKEPTTKNDLGVDCVARQDVERYIEGFINEYTPKEELEFINLELDGLKHLPSVTPQEPRWIPVSERLSKPFMYVNATCRSLVDDREDWVVETIYLPIPKEANKRGYSDWGNIPMLNWGKAEVIAWMERIIPEPYVREDNTDKEQI